MLIQIIGILLLVIFSYIIVKRFSKSETLVYEDEMSEDQLKELDEELD